MTVSASIYGALQRFGRPMTLRRVALGPGGAQVPLDLTVAGVDKAYKAAELVGSIQQGDSQVTITNTEIAARFWPGPPKNGDKVIIDGKVKAVVAVETKYLGPEKLVHVMQVRG